MANENANEPANDPEHYKTSASDRAHGTHGKGDMRETRLDDAPVEPAINEDIGVGRLSDASWGAPGAGGSTIDKLPEKNRKKADSEQGPAKGR